MQRCSQPWCRQTFLCVWFGTVASMATATPALAQRVAGVTEARRRHATGGRVPGAYRAKCCASAVPSIFCSHTT